MPESARSARKLSRGAWALFASLTAVIAGLPLASTAKADECTDLTIEAERKYDLPQGLLLSIALVESGMGGKPQPYALNLQGKSLMPQTISEARTHLRDGAGRLRKNTMVGCMQISLSHHKDQFKPVDRILDPRSNVFYAARYLKRLHAETGSWKQAVARYQGGTRQQRMSYLCRIHDNLVALRASGVDELNAVHCAQSDSPPSIAPETRRKFRKSQVASIEAIN